MNNLDLFAHSCANPEPMHDPAYQTSQLVICSAPATNALMLQHQQLIARLNAYQLALQDGDFTAQQTHRAHIQTLVETPDLNLSEFVSFWPTLNMSYSTYQKLNLQEKSDFLGRVLTLYIQERHALYQSHGYSATTLQVRADFEKHKRSGPMAQQKLAGLMAAAGFIVAPNLAFFGQAPKAFVSADSLIGREVIAYLKAYHQLEFRWAADGQDKRADFILKVHNKYYILEAKNMKEGGGGQDKQIKELIALIQQYEGNSALGYIAYLDGIYFNKLIAPSASARKIFQQSQDIQTALRANPENYFLNTAGFQTFLTQQ